MNSTGATGYIGGKNKANYFKLWIKINSRCFTKLNVKTKTKTVSLE